MHIGKFFDGWLTWKAEYPNLKDNIFESVFYTNADLDETLKEIIKDEKFTQDFIKHKKIIEINDKIIEKIKVPKNFLYKNKILQLSLHHSKKIWDLLYKKKFLDMDGYFTSKFKLDDLKKEWFTGLPKDITFAVIKNELQEFYNDHLANQNVNQTASQMDLWRHLYEQVWDYLKKKKLHPNITSNTDDEKRKLFRQFLSSFCFKTNQIDIEATEKKILENLSTLISHQPSDQHFLNLYYAIHEWFRKERKDRKQTPKLTNDVLYKLLEISQSRQNIILLQGRSQASLLYIFNNHKQQFVIRDELEQLNTLLLEQINIMITGEKGIGKSSLIKMALGSWHAASYLFFPATDLITNKSLINDLFDALTYAPIIKLIVIDGAELLLQLSQNEFNDLLIKLKNSKLNVILTITKDASLNSAFQNLNFKELPLHTLPIDNVLKAFPILRKYKQIEVFRKLIQKPFYLTIILRLLEQMKDEQLEQIVKNDSISLKSELINLLIKGQIESDMKDRQLAWLQLTFKIATSSDTGFNFGVPLISTKGIKSLLDDEIVMLQDGRYRFHHELFFEYGLMAFWLKKWESAYIKENTLVFWKKFPRYSTMVKYSTDSIVVKWIFYHSKIRENFLSHAENISYLPYLKRLMVLSIINHDNSFLNDLLSNFKFNLNEILQNVAGYDSTTFALLAIHHDNSEGLEILLQHGAFYFYPPPIDNERSSQSSSNESSSNESNSENHENSQDHSSEYSSEYEDFYQTKNSDETSASDSAREQNDYILQQEEIGREHFENIKRFICAPEKYFFAKFQNEPGFIDEEGEWEENSDYEPPPENGSSYISQAILSYNLECLNVLLDKHTSINSNFIREFKNNYNESSLHLAVLQNSYALVKTVIKHKVLSVHSQDAWGETPLHNAAYIGNSKIVALLLEHGADPNYLNEVGLSPLHIALVRLDFDMVKILFEYGSDFSHKAFELLNNEKSITDILEIILDKLINEKSYKNEFDEFIVNLIELLNFGEVNNTFNWSYKRPCDDDEKRQAQVDQVQELKELLDDEKIKLSDYVPGFSYHDEESKLHYVLYESGDQDELDSLKDYILKDIDRINEVFESDTFKLVKLDILDDWFSDINDGQIEILKDYADEYNDQEVRNIIEENTVLQTSINSTSLTM